MQKKTGFLLMALSVAFLLACSGMKARNDLDVHRSNMVSLTATVESVDMGNRLVRIKGPMGNSIVVHAGPEVKNLPQVKVGDLVAVEYYESLAVRMAKPGEVRAESAEISRSAEPGSKPAGMGAQQMTITATIEAIDKDDETVTLKGPDGTVVTVEVMEPENLNKVKVGDTIVMTYTEAMAVSIHEVGQ